MARAEGRGHEALRRGRWSAAGNEYFLTICTADRQAGLGAKAVSDAVLEEARRLETKGVWAVRTLVVMPDHVHVLAVLGEAMGLAETVRGFKGRLSVALRAHGLSWERGYFDHRIRADEDRAPVFQYIFLNPYRAGLIDHTRRWSGYYCAPADWEWFGGLTDEACPYPEWLE